MADDPAVDCDALREEISTLQAEFEGLWLQVSAGSLPTPRYRELRRMIDGLRATYTANCGSLEEESKLPRRIVSDWRAG
jgi:hypothetical protein